MPLPRTTFTQVQLQKVDPPTQVIDAFRDVQAARADKERLQNEAGSYANKVVPEARGDAERILQAARAYKEQAVGEATGQSARFLQIYEEYKKAPAVTRKRMYLVTRAQPSKNAAERTLDRGMKSVGTLFLRLKQSDRRGGAMPEDYSRAALQSQSRATFVGSRAGIKL
jgi:modulator of FtsH protease HflK